MNIKEEEKDEEPTYLDNVKTLVETLTENQNTLDSNRKLKLKDIRQYVADLNYSLLEIYKKLKSNLETPKNPEKKDNYFM